LNSWTEAGSVMDARDKAGKAGRERKGNAYTSAAAQNETRREKRKDVLVSGALANERRAHRYGHACRERWYWERARSRLAASRPTRLPTRWCWCWH
jgi:hypothetical protein